TFFLSLAVSTGAFAQESPQDSLFQGEILEPYGRYFEMPAEGIYTQFNKQAYMTGEGVWFKIYLLEIGKKRPFDLPQNVYAELFDPEGKPVDRQVLFAEKGSAQGVIRLPDTLVSGIYTFRAYTNWMRNSDKGLYTRTFRVSGGPAATAVGPAGDSADPGESVARPAAGAPYDIQFFPEGGQLLAEIVNNVGFKILDPSGKGEALNGLLKNSKGDTLLRFTTGSRGMGSLALEPLKGERYYADFFLPGSETAIQTVQLPEAQDQGITLNAQWFFPDKASILLRTNAASLPLLEGKKFYVLIHNQGNVARFLIINWSTRPILKLDVDKSLLLNGVNHITLFDEQYQPVADRMIFNKRKEQLGVLSVETSLEKDSMVYSLLARDSGSEPLAADMSVSFLPAGTLSGNFGTSIYSALLLESDLRGTVEEPAWYFEADDFQRMKALDDLLLTQGWRRYKWEDIRKGSRPAPVHIFEQGFTIKGKVVNTISGKQMEKSQVSVFSPENGIITAVDVDSSGAFELPNVFLIDSSRVIINASSAKGRSGFRELQAEITKPRYEKAAPPLPAVKDDFFTKEAGSLVLGGSELLEAVTVTGRAIPEEEAPFANSTYFSRIN
ncbi:MAG TPA: hypothetical protein VD772_11975, partial [Anseongella sp.]|nr:hypothetical protein [Anseongella sp.]